ncbi:MAG: hypothetical protein KDA76_04155 [Planctomycetaceae bacterium]|nr:hypothetical protein [Planctomycetaceae bacterium]
MSLRDQIRSGEVLVTRNADVVAEAAEGEIGSFVSYGIAAGLAGLRDSRNPAELVVQVAVGEIGRAANLGGQIRPFIEPIVCERQHHFRNPRCPRIAGGRHPPQFIVRVR